MNQETSRPPEQKNTLPKNIADQLANLGDNLIELSGKEITKKDALITISTITFLSILIGSHIKQDQLDQLSGFYRELSNRMKYINEYDDYEKSKRVTTELIAISSAILISTIPGYFASNLLSKLDPEHKTFLDKPVMPLSTHVLPKLGKILQKFRTTN